MNETAYGYIDLSEKGIINYFENQESEIILDFSDCIFDITSKNVVYAFNKKRLLISSNFGLNKNQIAPIMHSENYSFIKPQLSILNIMVDHEKIFLTCLDGNKYVLYLYQPQYVKKIKETMTIYSSCENLTVKQAIYEYHLQNPQIQVNYIIGDEQNYTQDTLETQINTGCGPDIIIGDNFLIKSLGSENLLLNLYEKIDFTDCFSFVRTAENPVSKTQYFYPGRFIMPAIGSHDKELIDCIRDSEALQLAVENCSTVIENPFNLFDSFENVFDLYYPLYASYIWENGSLNVEHYLSFLEKTSAITNTCNIKISTEILEIMPNNSLTYFMNGKYSFFCDFINRTDNLVTPFMSFDSFNEEKGVTIPLALINKQSICIPSYLISIPINSSHRAIEFANLLLSQVVQEKNLGDGIAINKKPLYLL